MSVYKRFNGKSVKRGSRGYDKGTWYYRFKIAGKLYHQSIPEAQTQDDAKIAEASVKSKIFNNKFNPAADKTTFKYFAENVFKPYAENKNPSYKTIETFVDRMIKYFGKSFLRDITPNDCRKYQDKCKARKKEDGEYVKNSTVNREMSTLKHLFNIAIEEELLDRNPCRVVKKLKEDGKRERLLDREEELRFWREVRKDSFLTDIVEIAVNTGIREGQILAIQKNNVDYEKGLLKIIASKGRDERIIPVNRKTLDVLRRASEGKRDYLFVSQRTKGKLSRFEKKWTKALEDAEIADFRFHDLRHYFASKLMRKNVPQMVIRDLLGHSSMELTSIYTNTDFDLLQSAVKLLDDEVLESDTIE